MASTVRTAKKLLLGREIAHMIESAGLSQADAAKLLETSQPRIASLISGGSAISPGDLVLLANKLGFTEEGYQEELLQLRRDNHKRGFWSTGHRRAYTQDFRLLVDLEQHADQMRAVETEVVPGLLQTEAYVRALHEDLAPDEEPGVSDEDFVQARLARTAIVRNSSSVSVHFVLSESSLRRMWAAPEVMLEQVEHLIAQSNRRNVVIQVMPFSSRPGRRGGIGYRFTLLRVPSPGAAGPLEVAYTESPGELRYLDDKKALSAHEDAWNRLADAALSCEESRKFMRGVAEEFLRMSDRE